MRKKWQRHIIQGVLIGIIFAVITLIVLVIVLIILNHKAIGTALGSIPGAILGAIVTFPPDWLISGAVGAALAFAACAIFWHWLDKPVKKHDNQEK